MSEYGSPEGEIFSALLLNQPMIQRIPKLNSKINNYALISCFSTDLLKNIYEICG